MNTVQKNNNICELYKKYTNKLLLNLRITPVKNKDIYMDFMCMLKVKHGKIVEKRAKYDRYDIFKQLGVTNLPLK